MEEDRLLRHFLFYCVKCLLGCHCPYEGLSLLGECYITVGTLSRLGIVLPSGNVALRVLVLGSE